MVQLNFIHVPVLLTIRPAFFYVKMKRHFSYGDMPKSNTQLTERYLTKEEERLMIKGMGLQLSPFIQGSDQRNADFLRFSR